MTKIILKAKNIVKTYTEGKVKTDVLKNVNLDIYEGELTAIIGKWFWQKYSHAYLRNPGHCRFWSDSV